MSFPFTLSLHLIKKITINCQVLSGIWTRILGIQGCGNHLSHHHCTDIQQTLIELNQCFQARTTNDENEVDENLEFDEKFFDDSKSSCEILRTVFLIQILHLLNFFSISKVSCLWIHLASAVAELDRVSQLKADAKY